MAKKKKMRLCVGTEKTFEEGFLEFILDCKLRNLRQGTIIHYEVAIKQIYKRASVKLNNVSAYHCPSGRSQYQRCIPRHLRKRFESNFRFHACKYSEISIYKGKQVFFPSINQSVSPRYT